MKLYPLGRQEAEALVDLLEANPDFQIHDKTALEEAEEIRQAFGMCSLEESKAYAKQWEADKASGNFVTVEIPPHHHTTFSQIKIKP